MQFPKIFALVAAGISACAALGQGIGADTSAQAFARQAKLALAQNPHLEYSPYTLIVAFDVRTSARSKAGAKAMVNGVFIKALGNGVELWGTTMHPVSAVTFLSMSRGVRYAEPDYVLRRAIIPNDTYFGNLWGMHQASDADIDAPEAWDVNTGSPSMVVAIIDTGTQLNHVDLAANIWTNPGEVAGNGVDDDGNGYVDDVNGWDFYDDDNNPSDSDGHGTHTAGTVGAVGNNGIGVAGVNWSCKLMALRFLGPGGGYTSDAVLALNYAAAKGVKVSNNSWGGGGFSTTLYNAINNSKSVGHVFVAAAGNAGSNNDLSPFYPASYNLDNLISVAATTSSDAKASWSNYGATSVDLGAPGSSILSTVPTNTYAYYSGTSMACPHVAGAAALLYAHNPGWTYQQVRQQIFNTVRPLSALAGITVTGGILNLQAALGSSSSNTPPTVNISQPADGSSFVQGSPVTFAASASDAEDGDKTASIVWTSSLDGQIGTGGSFTTSSLSVGTHTVTASVTDSGGLPGSDSITVTITTNLPSAPTNFAVRKIANGVARATWTDTANNELGFTLERQKKLGGGWSAPTQINLGANVQSHDDPAGGGTFRYRIQAYNAFGVSSWTGYKQVKL